MEKQLRRKGYNIGGGAELENLELVERLCAIAEAGLRHTFLWYLENEAWWRAFT